MTFAEWHQKAKKELNRILYSYYDTIKKNDNNRERDFTKLVNGYNFKVGKDNKDMKICEGRFVSKMEEQHGFNRCNNQPCQYEQSCLCRQSQ